jgi:hypothetical protein
MLSHLFQYQLGMCHGEFQAPKMERGLNKVSATKEVFLGFIQSCQMGTTYLMYN